MESLKTIIKQWVAEYEAINGVTVKIKASKKLSNEYVLRHYYRCHHNMRPSPSKDPQRKLLLNPSARASKVLKWRGPVCQTLLSMGVDHSLVPR